MNRSSSFILLLPFDIPREIPLDDLEIFIHITSHERIWCFNTEKIGCRKRSKYETETSENVTSDSECGAEIILEDAIDDASSSTREDCKPYCEVYSALIQPIISFASFALI